VIDAIVLRIDRLIGRITALDQVHARSFLNMGRSLLHVSGMNQEALERLKIKDKRLDALSELPRTFFLLEESVLIEAGRLTVQVLCVTAYLTPAGPLLSLCSNFMCCSLS
jgi:hypothetical protein